MAEIEDTTKLLSKPWQKFLAKFDEINILPNSEWKEVHLLGHICKRYEQLYNVKYCLSFKGAPSKCTEIYMVKQIMAMLGTTNMRTIRSYIDWVYDFKVAPKSVKFRTLGYFTTPGYANEFMLWKIESSKVTKSTDVPETLKQVSVELDIPVSTYGDLAFIKKAVDANPTSESLAQYRILLNKMIAVGLDLSTLKGLV